MPARPRAVRGGLAVRLLRALRLRCPACGGGPVLRTWFRLRPRCPSCGIRTGRGADDLALGGMMFNLVLAEGVLVALLVGIAVLTWPDVPWTALHAGGIAAMVVAPFAFYPVSRLLWMAIDLMLRPPGPDDLAPPRGAGSRASGDAARR